MKRTEGQIKLLSYGDEVDLSVFGLQYDPDTPDHILKWIELMKNGVGCLRKPVSEGQAAALLEAWEEDGDADDDIDREEIVLATYATELLGDVLAAKAKQDATS